MSPMDFPVNRPEQAHQPKSRLEECVDSSAWKTQSNPSGKSKIWMENFRDQNPTGVSTRDQSSQATLLSMFSLSSGRSEVFQLIVGMVILANAVS